MLKVYFKPDCSTCKTTLDLLSKETDEKPELVEYLVENPGENEIREILKMLSLPAEEIVRKKEQLYQDNYAGKNLNEDEWISILAQNPVLIERPIVVIDGKAIIARPPEKIHELLNPIK